MAELPLVSGLVLASRYELDKPNREVILRGVKRALVFSSFPSKKQPYVVYTVMFGGHGSFGVELACMHLQKEEDVFRFSTTMACPAADLSWELVLPLENFRFLEPGRYALTLLLRFQANHCSIP